MKSFGKITLINLGILLAYSVALRFVIGRDHNGLGIAIASMGLIAFHVIVNLFLTIYFYGFQKKELGSAFLVNIFIVALVGFGVCLGNASF